MSHSHTELLATSPRISVLPAHEGSINCGGTPWKDQACTCNASPRRLPGSFRRGDDAELKVSSFAGGTEILFLQTPNQTGEGFLFLVDSRAVSFHLFSPLRQKSGILHDLQILLQLLQIGWSG